MATHISQRKVIGIINPRSPLGTPPTPMPMPAIYSDIRLEPSYDYGLRMFAR